MAAQDVAPELLEAVRAAFERGMKQDKELVRLLERISTGEASFADAGEYAARVGEALSAAFGECLSSEVLPEGRMWYNIADRVVRPMLEEDHRLVTTAAAETITAQNREAGIGMTAQTVPVDEDRIQGLLDRVSSEPVYDDAAWLLDAPVVNFSQAAADETLKRNVGVMGKSGLRARIIRKAEHKCCAWCSGLAGTYDYPGAPDDVYRRHERCRCVVEYDPGKGKQRQNVHSKEWTDAEKYDKLKNKTDSGAVSGARKTQGWKGRHADRYYEEIRNRSEYSDAIRIAASVPKFTVDQVEDIRQHIFIRKQPRSGGYFRFDSDYDIALAWQRLTEGKDIRESDKILLMHEYEELTIMRNTGCTYEEAHDLANAKYNWWEAVMKEG